jgi:hypothetical protein
VTDADVIVVDEPADLFGAAFCDWALARGVRAARLRLPEVASELSIAGDGDRPTVEPEMAMLLRPLQGVRPPALPDERFIWGEQFATLWAAAALTRSPVVNRPNEWGWASKTTMSAVVTERRAGLEAPPAESVWKRCPPGKPFSHHQDLETWAQPDDPSQLEFGRSRALPPMCGFDQVVVVGERAWRVTAPGVHDAAIEETSIRATAVLALAFATISWGFPADGGAPLITKINGFPTLRECVPVLDSVFDALLEQLQL